MKKIIGLLLLIILIYNCGIRKTTKSIEKTDKEKRGIINESFDPLILNDNEIKIKSSKHVEAKSDYNNSFIQSIKEKENYKKDIQGYRVQICAVSDQEAARNIQREVILKFNEKVYLIYDSPYYKIRIGDCTSRFEADKLQKLAVEKGFNDAWVVKTMVKPKAKFESENNFFPVLEKDK